MQQYTLIIEDFFCLKDIFECGQCFRWNENEDGSYTGVFGKNVINVKEEIIEEGKVKVIFQGLVEGKLEEIVKEYFDLKRDYREIRETLKKIDTSMKVGVEYGKGIRILNQELWEMIVSFIISANNNIPRIKGIIERICEEYGDKLILELEGDKKVYYTFPTPEQLKEVKIEDYRRLGAGFRDIRIWETVHIILEGKVNLEELKQEKDTQIVREKLLTLSGVGPKVADCILLFSELKRLEVFPIDVWVRRVMNELYIKEQKEDKVSKKQIEELAKSKFGNLAGIAQQYLFYWEREKKKKAN